MTGCLLGKHACTHVHAHKGCGPNPRLHAKRWMALGFVCLICEMGCTMSIKGKGPEGSPICTEHALLPLPLPLQLCTSAPHISSAGLRTRVSLLAGTSNFPTCPQQNPPPSPTHLLILLCSRTPGWDLLRRPPEPGVGRMLHSLAKSSGSACLDSLPLPTAAAAANSVQAATCAASSCSSLLACI